MIEIHSIASSSSGNAYVVRAPAYEDSTILLEAGLPWAKLQVALEHRATLLAGVLLSHEHQDHANLGSVRELLKRGVRVLASAGTWDAIERSLPPSYVLEAYKPQRVGLWRVTPFPAIHDAAEPLGFTLDHPCGARVAYLTDSAYSPARIRGITHAILEANYSQEILDRNLASGAFAVEHRNRVVRNHMSIDNAIDFLLECGTDRLEEVTLVHLSDGNSDEAAFIEEVQRRVGVPARAALREATSASRPSTVGVGGPK